MTSAARAPQLKRRLTRRALGRMDPVTLAVMNNRLAAIAEEMGVVLGQTGYSPNIKERRDYSCALFDGRGELVAQAAHIPVHLGSTPLSVRAAIERLELQNGDVAVLNDPYAGGTHLPDVTVVMPVFLRGQKTAFAYVANRAHHADIGGMAPGSMALSTEIYQEGLRLPPVKLMVGGKPRGTCSNCFWPTPAFVRSAKVTCGHRLPHCRLAPSGLVRWSNMSDVAKSPLQWKHSRIMPIA